VIFFFLFSQSAIGWSWNGHKIIADLSQSLLNLTNPDVITKCLSRWFPANESVSLSSIAHHPDQYKNNDFNAYHFMNLPGDPVNGTFIYDASTCPDGKCIIGAAGLFAKRFATEVPKFSFSDNPSSLSFLVHFMGDIHQPLHVSYGSDVGGNKINVTLFGKHANLHSIWDGGMMEYYIGNLTGEPCGYPQKSCNWTIFSEFLKKEMTANMPLVRGWQKFPSFSSIGEDSFKIVNSNCYSYLREKKRHMLQSPIELGLEYFTENFPIVRQRLMMAGARLAIVLQSTCAKHMN